MENVVNIIIISLAVIVVFCLFRALYFMVSSKGQKKEGGVANFLLLRVIFSAILIGFLVVANYVGWIEFHGPYQDPRLVPQILKSQQADQNTIDQTSKSSADETK